MIFGELEMKQIGNLAEAPTFRQNENGSKVANFRLITNVRWKDKASGDFKDRAEGFNYELWGEGAEHIRALERGQQLYVSAEPYNDSYEVNGEKRYQIRFRVTRWVVLGGRKGAPNGKPDQAAGGEIPADSDPF